MKKILLPIICLLFWLSPIDSFGFVVYPKTTNKPIILKNIPSRSRIKELPKSFFRIIKKSNRPKAQPENKRYKDFAFLSLMFGILGALFLVFFLIGPEFGFLIALIASVVGSFLADASLETKKSRMGWIALIINLLVFSVLVWMILEALKII